MDPAWIVAACALATIIVGLVAWLARGAWHIAKEFLEFSSEWKGTPDSHGRPGRPGVLDRLSKLEGTTEEISRQVHLNSGQSMKDVVTRTEETANRTEAAVATLQKSVSDLSARVNPSQGGQP